MTPLDKKINKNKKVVDAMIDPIVNPNAKENDASLVNRQVVNEESTGKSR